MFQYFPDLRRTAYIIRPIKVQLFKSKTNYVIWQKQLAFPQVQEHEEVSKAPLKPKRINNGQPRAGY